VTATALAAPDTAILRAIVREARFDATRPPCPPWCDNSCRVDLHFGDAVMHSNQAVQVPSTADRIGEDGFVTVRAWRHDSLDERSTAGIQLGIEDAGSVLDDEAGFSAAQARKLASELLAAADRIDPAPPGEVTVAAHAVRIGDRLNVNGEWLHVYGVLADEPSNNVQVNVTRDPVCWSDLDERDEDPEAFALTDTVRVRRAALSDGGTP
jgi:hypothetical protein